MHFRGVSVREIPFMLFLGLLFAVTVGWWVFLTYGFGRFRKRGCCGIRRVLGTFRHRRLRACARIRFP